jgi:hypothetical protein
MGATTNCRAYRALCAQSEAIGWPEFYEADLHFHDHDRLCGGGDGSVPEGAPFAWLVRHTGTWLLDDVGSEGQAAVLRYAEQWEAHRAFWWDGRRLAEVPLASVRDRLHRARSHARVA